MKHHRFSHRFTLALAACTGLCLQATIPMIAASGFVLAVAPGDAIAATTWYVNATAGDNANPGTTPQNPFLTIQKAFDVCVAGDTIYLNGLFRLSTGATLTGKSNVTITSEPGASQAEIRWETLAGTGWTDLTGGRWSKNLPAGLGSGGGSSAVNGEILRQWNITTAVGGRPSGHLRYVVGSGSLWSYDYNNATGATTINITGSPNGATTDVSYSVGSSAQTISIEGGSNLRIYALTFSLSCASGSSYSLFIHNSAGTRVMGCSFYDAQWHHAGFLNHNAGAVPAVNNTFEFCVFSGGAPGLAHAVHYAENVVRATGARWTGCVFWGHRYLDPTGALMGGQAATTQIPCISHGNALPSIDDIMADSCRFVEFEPGWLPFTCNDPAASSASWTFDSFPARMDRCVFTGDGTIQVGATHNRFYNNRATRRCIFDYRNAGPSGLCDGGKGCIQFNVASAGTFLSDSDAYIFNLRDDVNDTEGFAIFGAAHEVRFVNPSIYEISTAHGTKGRRIFSPLFRGDVTFRVRGGAVAFGESYSGNKLCTFDGSIGAARHDILDLAVFNVSVFSDDATLDTQAEWIANVCGGDATLLRVLGSAPFTRYAADGNLGLDASSSLWAVRRVTSAVVPSSTGINGIEYRTFYGAYQYADLTGRGRPNWIAIGLGL